MIIYNMSTIAQERYTSYFYSNVKVTGQTRLPLVAKSLKKPLELLSQVGLRDICSLRLTIGCDKPIIFVFCMLESRIA